jgi:hypothetical protein
MIHSRAGTVRQYIASQSVGRVFQQAATRTVSVTVMLMGLVIEEDMKNSKGGCEELDHAGGNALWHYRLTIAKAKSRPRPRDRQLNPQHELQIGGLRNGAASTGYVESNDHSSNAPFQDTRG